MHVDIDELWYSPWASAQRNAPAVFAALPDSVHEVVFSNHEVVPSLGEREGSSWFRDLTLFKVHSNFTRTVSENERWERRSSERVRQAEMDEDAGIEDDHSGWPKNEREVRCACLAVPLSTRPAPSSPCAAHCMCTLSHTTCAHVQPRATPCNPAQPRAAHTRRAPLAPRAHTHARTCLYTRRRSMRGRTTRTPSCYDCLSCSASAANGCV